MKPITTALAGIALLSALTAPALAAAAPATTTTYVFTPETEVDYFVEHPMHHVKGVTHALAGDVAVTNDKLVTPVTIKLPLLTFNSGNGNRDNNAALILDVARFPAAAVDVQKFVETGRTKENGVTKLTGTAHGNLSLHGITRPVEVPLTVTVGANQLIVDGTLTVKLSEYKIERPSLLFTPINDDVKVAIHGVAAPHR